MNSQWLDACANAVRSTAAALLAFSCAAAGASGGPLGIDHRLALDQGGIWARRNQLALEYGVIGFELAGAMWLGSDDEFGRTLWQTVDSSAVSALGATGLKFVFARSRPSAGQGPDNWFQGRGARSFPSGEVTLQAAFVTPIIVNYAARYPWVWALEVLPVYDGVARVKSQSHWQSDVLVGWAIGTAAGYWATQRETPFSVQLLPRGLSVGYSRKF
jgi:undecaprenyl-diphosphatase